MALQPCRGGCGCNKWINGMIFFFSSIRLHAGHLRMFCAANSVISPSPRHPGSASTFLHRWDCQCGWILEFDSDYSAASLATAWRLDLVFSASDGSFSESYGTASVQIWDSKRFHSSTFPMPGLASDQSAPRSEAMRILAQIWFISALYDMYGLTDGVITLGCDGLSVLQDSFAGPENPTRTKYPIVQLWYTLTRFLRNLLF